MTNSRNIGFNHGQNGKGDADRTIDTPAYRKNLAGINWGDEPVCFEKRGRKLVKTYGTNQPCALPLHLHTGILRNADVHAGPRPVMKGVVR